MLRTPNTDNKINRFVTVFALTFCHLDSLVKRDKPGPRTCFLLIFYIVTANQHVRKLVPRNIYKPDSLYLDGKNCAVLRLLRPQTGPAPKRGYYSTASIRTDAPSGRSVPSAQQRLRTLLPGR
jgi:hypothetical protein